MVSKADFLPGYCIALLLLSHNLDTWLGAAIRKDKKTGIVSHSTFPLNNYELCFRAR